MLQTLFVLAAIAIAVSTFLETQLLFAKAAGKRVAESYAVLALPRAQAFLLREVAAQVAVAGTSVTIAPAPLPADCISPSFCSMRVQATYTVTGSTTQSTGASTAQNVQTVSIVNEQRTALQITVDIIDSANNVIAARTTLATLRTFAAPPYAVLDGIQDTADDDGADAQTDTGGCDPGTPATCDTSAVGTLSDTRIHAAQTCAEDGNGGHCTGPAPVSIDAFASPTWTNGNATAPGWSR
jgi:hypothetical protein